MKNKNSVSLTDAYRIYTGHRFGRTVLSSAVLAVIAAAVLSCIFMISIYPEVSTWVVTDSGHKYIDIDNGRMVTLPVYLLMLSLTDILPEMSFLVWLMIYLKRLGNSDISDINAPGGKYLCTVRGGCMTYEKAHIMMNAEHIVIAVILLVPSAVIDVAISANLWCDPVYMPKYISGVFGQCFTAAACCILPMITANLCELHPGRMQRIVLTMVLCPVTSLMYLSAADGMKDSKIAVLLLLVLLLSVSEYILIKKRNRDIYEDSTGSAQIRGVSQ